MSRDYYQVGWVLNEDGSDNYYVEKDNNKYFVKKNITPIISLLSAEKIVPKVKWSKRLANGDTLIAQDFENGRTLNHLEMDDTRIPEILSKVHKSAKLKKMMTTYGYREENVENLLSRMDKMMSEELLRNTDVAHAYSYLKKFVPNTSDFVPCHANVFKENWLLSDSNKLFLVDWEQALLGDAAIDISLILYTYIPQENWETWLASYGVDLTLEYRRKLKWYITFQALIMVVWYYEQRHLSDMNEWLIFINKIFNNYN